MDRSVLPGDDFFEYANGTWIKNNQIPADKSRYGMFNVLDDLSRERTRTIINEQSKDPNNKIGNAYSSFMDEQAIEAKGLTPLNPWLNRIKAIRGKAGLPALYAEADRIGVNIPVRMFIGQDRKASDRYALNMSQSGLGMQKTRAGQATSNSPSTSTAASDGSAATRDSRRLTCRPGAGAWRVRVADASRR